MAPALAPAWALAFEIGFGGFAPWRADFVRRAEGLKGEGAARVVLAFDPSGGRMVNRVVPHADDAAPQELLAWPPRPSEQAVDVERFIDQQDWDAVYLRYQAAVDAASVGLEASADTASALAAAAAGCLLDVRRAGAYAQAAEAIPGAQWRDPAQVAAWGAGLPRGEPVIVYCVWGHEVGRATTLQLRAAGHDARFLEGGIEGWKAQGRAVGPRPAPPRVALLYPGDREARDRADPAASRFAALFAALAQAGIAAEPAVWHEDFEDEVAAQLRGVALVLVWCNPIEGGRTRARLDAMLSRLAAEGVVVSAHPQAIQRLGTKDVLFETRELPFGSDVQRIDSLAQLAAELPARLRQGPRVLKQHRGHSGIGIWRVERVERVDDAADGSPHFHLRHAQRGSAEETVDLATLCQRLAPYFEPAAGGHMLDQAWQPGLVRGMVRAYLVRGRVAGFGHQAINALHPSEPQPGPRLYHGPDEAPFQPLRGQLEEGGWIALLGQCVGLAVDELPLLWDCDFIPAEPDAAGQPRWVLCEINVSSVSPFPPSAVAPLVAAVAAEVARAQRRAQPA